MGLVSTWNRFFWLYNLAGALVLLHKVVGTVTVGRPGVILVHIANRINFVII